MDSKFEAEIGFFSSQYLILKLANIATKMVKKLRGKKKSMFTYSRKP